MDGIDGRVRSAVDVWLRWLPRWQIGTARPRTRICRKCTGSPIASAAGFGQDVPHAVQHALIGRISTIVEDAVDDYTAKNLPLLQRELERAAARKRHAGYQPAEGLSPEFQGLDVDPEPSPGSPFLFTLGELAGTGAGSRPRGSRCPTRPRRRSGTRSSCPTSVLVRPVRRCAWRSSTTGRASPRRWSAWSNRRSRHSCPTCSAGSMVRTRGRARACSDGLRSVRG
ncbi:hypothetical protein JN350_08045 [Curtobacterium sp. 24E2]|nr:hypothetical protein JN350_08045 [Curtobacterium sp. 24E2]